MRITCPKCKTKLKLNLKTKKTPPEGLKIKCPKCGAILRVRLPERKGPATGQINKNLVLVAHASEDIIEKAREILTEMGYQVITSTDGVDTMIKIMSQMPFLLIIDVALPKIFGFEICKRVKNREETSQIKILLVTSVYDKKRYLRPPEDLYGADDYINEPEIEEKLRDKIRAIIEGPQKETPPARTQEPEEPPGPGPEPGPEEDASAERARRLVRTILSDIMLYHKDRVLESALNDTFREEFASDLQEGLKLYNMRIPPEVRAKRDYFNEEIDKFIEKIKKEANI